MTIYTMSGQQKGFRLDAETKFVLLADHEHALAEKDQRRLETIAMCDQLKLERETAERGEHAAILKVEELERQLAEQARELERLRGENEYLEQLFDKQHKRVVDADKLWSDAHNKPLVKPDLGELIGWLIKRHDDLLRTAVKFALHVDRDAHCGPEADAFLATPAATALQIEEKK